MKTHHLFASLALAALTSFAPAENEGMVWIPGGEFTMGSFHFCHQKAVFTSFVSPYSLLDYRNFPNLISAHSSFPDSQRSAVASRFGEIPFAGSSPVINLTHNTFQA